MKEYYIRINGVKSKERQKIILQLKVGERLSLIPDLHNPYDNHGVKVMTKNGEQVGFLQKSGCLQKIYESRIR